MTLAVNIAQGGSNNVTFRNRIINGACVIDQRNAGGTVSTNGSLPVDRFVIIKDTVAGTFTMGQSNTVPSSGFTKSALFTVGTAYTPSSGENNFFKHLIEGYNVADLNFGSSTAATVTLSFWVRCSLTGTFGGAVRNGNSDRSYVFSYTISSANTFEYKTITIPGYTSGGTWNTTNGNGLEISWGLSVGSTYSNTAGAWYTGNYISATGATNVTSTAGATWYITGVQLEAGTTASPFEYRQYGTELALCQRYASSTFPQGTAWAQNAGRNGAVSLMSQNTSARQLGYFTFPVTMRANPTLTSYSTNAATSAWWNDTTGVAESAATFTASIGDRGQGIFTTSVASAVSQVFLIHVSASAEL